MDRPSVVLVASRLRNAWPNQDPIGKHLTLTFYPGIVREVVGVVAM